jgi:hypothetical protein
MTTLLNRTLSAVKINESGGAHSQGDICIEDPSNAGSVINDTSGSFADGPLWVCLEPAGVADGAQGLYASLGYVPKITLSASASLGDLVRSHTVAKQGTPHAAPMGPGDFAQVLGTGTSPEAWLFGIAPPPPIELLAEVTPSGVATIELASGIPAIYSNLIIDFSIRGSNASDFIYLHLQFNGDTTAGNYRYIMSYVYGTNSTGAEGGDDNKIGVAAAANSPAGSCGAGCIEIPFPNSAFKKQAFSSGSLRRDASAVHEFRPSASLEWENTDPIDEIDIALSAGNYAAGSILRLYGVR